MLLKLSLSSIRKKMKDYIVLLFGLVISISIFYMFQTLAQNKEFIEANSVISSIVFVFHVGTAILSVITLFYIFYATSFILSLRQKELGMYMMLGAKKSRVTQVMFFETFAIGLISLFIGLLVGIGLSTGIGDLLMKQLGFPADGFKPFYLPSITTTLIFYIILFLLTSIVNAAKIAKKSILEILTADGQSEPGNVKRVQTLVKTMISVILIGIGYFAFINMDKLLHFGVIISAITTTTGTYLIFNSFLPYFVQRLKQVRHINEKGLNSFTYAQLRFRVVSLSKVLGTVTMLIALGVGAMAAGLSFYINISHSVNTFYTYDVAIHHPNEADEKALEKMNLTDKLQYRYKIDDQSVYFLKDDLIKNPPLAKEDLKDEEVKRISAPLPEQEYIVSSQEEPPTVPEVWSRSFFTDFNVSSQLFADRTVLITDKERYDQFEGKEYQLLVAMTDDFLLYELQLKEIGERQKEVAQAFTGQELEMFHTKYTDYEQIKAIMTGTVFMGFFLGIAFLMMMASVLMFKILSSATTDIKRYSMLRKIGVRKPLLIKSIYKELFIVFTFPALLGIVHVLAGMIMFSFILVDPYLKIWVPITIFLIIYAIYYLVTVQLYKGIVLPKEA
ncbi:ABC transporter permease [Bacillus aquiflavi]|uniref:FtsX-like permease family protein n=1 Tax=Bacillus aquiflavi TaxID=2672567 RepID=UPI001CA98061|nr:ABC transporter permease [Bacillus aquiflavi]UAC48369.1 ABC transporter permease [Bacillus aquiflavi]